MLSISEPAIDWCLSILSDSVQWTVTVRHRSVPPSLLCKHLIPWIQHSVRAFQIWPPISHRSHTPSFWLWWGKRHSSCLTGKALHFKTAGIVVYLFVCFKWEIWVSGLSMCMHCAPVGVCVCIPLNAWGWCVSDSRPPERAEEHGDAVGRLCGGCGLLLRCPHWR